MASALRQPRLGRAAASGPPLGTWALGRWICLATLLAVGWAGGARRRAAKVVATRSASNGDRPTNPADETARGRGRRHSVEMFAAMKSGEIDVKFIPKDDREARVMFKNKTKRPLSVRLPAAFAAVPVLAQRGGGGGGMGGMDGWHVGGMSRDGRRHGWHGRRNGWRQ